MHVPRDRGERVQTPEGPGEWTGETGEYGEHFEIQLDDGDTIRFHKEDLHRT